MQGCFVKLLFNMHNIFYIVYGDAAHEFLLASVPHASLLVNVPPTLDCLKS